MKMKIQMNRKIPAVGSAIVTAAVLLFALCLAIDYTFGSYVVCMFLPIGYIMMVSGFRAECNADRKAAADAGTVFSAIYAVLIFIVYFAQTTTVRLDRLEGQAALILDFRRGGLLFSYDLLGYGMMALSTFFVGLSMRAQNRADKWLKYLLMIHGAFFAGCFVMPMTGVFSGMADGETSNGGVAALLIWCACFLPAGALSLLHFRRAEA